MEADEIAFLDRCERRLQAALKEACADGERTCRLVELQRKQLEAGQRSFRQVKEQMLRLGQDGMRARLAQARAEMLQRSLKIERVRVLRAAKGQSQAEEQRAAAGRRYSLCRARLQRVQELNQHARHRVAEGRESLAAELQQEAWLECAAAARKDEFEAARLLRASEEEPADGGGPSAPSEALCSPGCAAAAPVDAHAFSNDAPNARHPPGGGAPPDAAERKAERRLDAGERLISLEELRRQIEAVDSWEGLSGAGVRLDYRTGCGRMVELRITSTADGGVRVALAPEFQRDVRALWGEKGVIAEALRASGLRVDRMIIARG